MIYFLKKRKFKFIISLTIIFCIVFTNFMFNVEQAEAINPAVAIGLMGLTAPAIATVGALLVAGGLTFATHQAVDYAVGDFMARSSPTVRNMVATSFNAVSTGAVAISQTIWEFIRSHVQNNYTVGANTEASPVYFHGDIPFTIRTDPTKVPILTVNAHEVKSITVNLGALGVSTLMAHRFFGTSSIDSIRIFNNDVQVGSNLTASVGVPVSLIVVWHNDFLHLQSMVGNTFSDRIANWIPLPLSELSTNTFDYVGQDVILNPMHDVLNPSGERVIHVPHTTNDLVNKTYDDVIQPVPGVPVFNPPGTVPVSDIPISLPWSQDGIVFPWDNVQDIPLPAPIPVTDARTPIAGELGLLSGLWEWLKNIYDLIKYGILNVINSIIAYLQWIITAIVTGLMTLIDTIKNFPNNFQPLIPSLPTGVLAIFPNLILLILAIIAFFAKILEFVATLGSIPATTAMLHPSIIEGINFGKSLNYRGVNLYGLIIGIANIYLGLMIFKMFKSLTFGIGKLR